MKHYVIANPKIEFLDDLKSINMRIKLLLNA